MERSDLAAGMRYLGMDAASRRAPGDMVYDGDRLENRPERPVIQQQLDEVEKLLAEIHAVTQRIGAAADRIRIEPSPAQTGDGVSANGINAARPVNVDARLRDLAGIAGRTLAELMQIAKRLDRAV